MFIAKLLNATTRLPPITSSPSPRGLLARYITFGALIHSLNHFLKNLHIAVKLRTSNLQCTCCRDRPTDLLITDLTPTHSHLFRLCQYQPYHITGGTYITLQNFNGFAMFHCAEQVVALMEIHVRQYSLYYRSHFLPNLTTNDMYLMYCHQESYNSTLKVLYILLNLHPV